MIERSNQSIGGGKVKAVWDIEYDSRQDKIYDCPSCPECRAPVMQFEDGYRCICCGKELEIDAKMKEWFQERNGYKTEMKNCFKCGGVACLETHYRKSPVTLKWEAMRGKCSKCGMEFIV